MKMNITPVRFAREVILALAWGIILSYVLHQVMLPELGHHISMLYTFSWGLIYAGILMALSYYSAMRAALAHRSMEHTSMIQSIEAGERLQQLKHACWQTGVTVDDLVKFKEDLQQLRAK